MEGKETEKEEKVNCSCNENNNENCSCTDENNDCHCGQDKCDCNDQCNCDNTCDCGDECECDDSCNCGEQDKCSSTCNCQSDKAQEYLDLARQVQADFDNYRRHAVEDKNRARTSGQISVIEAFLPCLDTFKEAKKSISDENVLKGVEMIESKINQALESLGVKKMQAIGQVYNPHFHHVIAVTKDENQENDIIIDEYQAGYTFNDQVIRYAKVIVNKKEGN